VLQRVGTDRAPTVTDVAPLIVFFLASMIMSSVANALRVTRRRAADASAELRDVALQLEEQAVELEQQLEESQALQEELEQTSAELAERTHQAEAADAFSRGILASISDPFVVQDRDWRFVYINAPAAELFARAGHVSPESLIGRGVWDIFPETVGTETERGMRHAKEQGIPYSFEVYSPDAATWSVMNCYPSAERRPRDAVEGHHRATARRRDGALSGARERGARQLAGVRDDAPRARARRGAGAGRMVHDHDRRR
jgi:Transcriptional regulator containing PAS, AAA-type ATPase, and DNA-binding domains